MNELDELLEKSDIINLVMNKTYQEVNLYIP